MSKKISIILIFIIILISLIISIYLPNKGMIEEIEDMSINYLVVESDGKYGVAKNENIVIEPQYKEIIIPNCHRAVFICDDGNNKKVINEQNTEIFKKYKNIEPIEIDELNYEKNILKYKENDKYGLVSIIGKKITQAKYDEISSFGYKDGEVQVKENGKYGIIDEQGNQKIKSKYDLIESDEYYTKENEYRDSGYIVQNITSDGYRYGYYDKEGSQVLTEEYNQINRITEIDSNDIYLIASRNGQYGVFVNNSKIINTQYQMIEYKADSQMFIVERTQKYGVINLNGVQILKPEFDELQIKGIYIYTLKGEEKNVWDDSGKEVNIPFNTVIQKASSEYYIKNEDGNYYILNSEFEQISQQKYNYLEFAYDKHFIASNEKDKYGIIDLQENIIVDFKYDIIQTIKGKFATQAIDFTTNKTSIYDNQFALTVEMDGGNIEDIENGFKIYNEEKEIYLNDNGKAIIE